MLSRICFVAALLFATQATAYTHIREDFDLKKGNSTFKGELDTYAGIKHCDGDDMQAAHNWQQGLLQAVKQGPNAMMAFMMSTPPPPPCPATPNEETYTRAAVEGEIDVEVFGNEMQLVEAFVEAVSETGSSHLKGRLRVLGSTVWQQEANQLMYVRGAKYEKKKKIGVGPLKVEVKGKASALVGVTAGAGVGPEQITVVGTPFAVASGSASASMGGLCASVSVKGEVELIELDLPVQMSLNWGGNEVDWSIEADLDYDLPDGSLKVVAKACGPKYTHTLASFDFGGGSIHLFDASGSL